MIALLPDSAVHQSGQLHSSLGRSSTSPEIIALLRDFTAVAIPLTNGGFTTIDIQDAPRALQHRWTGIRFHNRGSRYAIISTKSQGHRPLLHRFVLGATSPCVDHCDHDGLNNRRLNLRPATDSQNQANRGAEKGSALGVKGVWRTRRGYRSAIQVNRKRIYLGTYSTIEAARAAYREAAKEHFGEFAGW